MSREINGHRVLGREIVVSAYNEADARKKAKISIGEHIWEVKELSLGIWELYVAKHEDCFALND